MLFRHRRIHGSRIVVTGASGGIGLAIAEELARRGAKLVLNARREEVLQEIAGRLKAQEAEVEIVAGDITDSAVRERLLVQAGERFGGLDILVNNAGIGTFGRFADSDAERLRRVMEVDFFSTVELTRTALPQLRAGVKPMVVNIASILGHRGIPYGTEYCAAKFAMRGFSEALRPELHKLGIDVLLVSPGTTKTRFFNNVLKMDVELPWRKQTGGGVTPEYVAQRTADAIERNKTEIIPSVSGALMVLANRLAPRLINRIMQRYG
ncbi:MAG: SDR family NAD(P)-dependent oxidoreductase [Planctomycetia bacterium]|nr:SDR family NAD(P)-dependent oxidoreductase [Planctomycetia bacterium]